MNEVLQNQFLKVSDIIGNRYFLRFLEKYQQRYHQGERRHYKNFPKQGKNNFSQDFYNDIEDVFGDTQEFQTFCAEFREEMLCRPHIWQQIQADCDDDEFVIFVLSFLRLYYKIGEASTPLKEIFQTKIREILQEAKQTVNHVNGLDLQESIQLGREQELFPIDSKGDVCIFFSKNGNNFEVVRQRNNHFATVDVTGKIIQIHIPEIDLFGGESSREELLRRKEQFEFFLKIYQAFSGQLEEEISIPAEELEVYGDLIEKWIETQSDLILQEGVDVLIQEDGKWGNVFQVFLEESIEKLEQKTRRAQLQLVVK